MSETPQNTNNTIPLPPPEDTFARLAEDELRAQQNQAAAAEARHFEQSDKYSHAIGSLILGEQARVANARGVAEVLNGRSVTDPDSQAPHASRPDETWLSRHTSVPIVEKVAGRYGKDALDRTPDADKSSTLARRAPGTTVPEGQGQLPRGQQQDDLQTAQLTREQLIRQARSEATEATFGAGIGLGAKAKWATRRAKKAAKKDIAADHQAGNISAAERLALEGMAERETNVQVPVRAARRDVRRERAGGIEATIKTAQPVKTALRSREFDKTMDKLQGEAMEINAAKDKQHSLQREIDLREVMSQLPPDAWEDSLGHVAGEYREGAEQGMPQEFITPADLTLFIVRKYGLFTNLARDAGLDISNPGAMSDADKDTYAELSRQARDQARPLANIIFDRMQQIGIVSETHEVQQGAAEILAMRDAHRRERGIQAMATARAEAEAAAAQAKAEAEARAAATPPTPPTPPAPKPEAHKPPKTPEEFEKERIHKQRLILADPENQPFFDPDWLQMLDEELTTKLGEAGRAARQANNGNPIPARQWAVLKARVAADVIREFAGEPIDDDTVDVIDMVRKQVTGKKSRSGRFGR